LEGRLRKTLKELLNLQETSLKGLWEGRNLGDFPFLWVRKGTVFGGPQGLGGPYLKVGSLIGWG